MGRRRPGGGEGIAGEGPPHHRPPGWGCETQALLSGQPRSRVLGLNLPQGPGYRPSGGGVRGRGWREMCVCSSFPISSLSTHPRALASFGKCRPRLHLGNPAGAPNPPPSPPAPLPRGTSAHFRESKTEARRGSLRGRRRGASSLRAGPTSFPSQGVASVGQTGRRARCRVATAVALSRRCYTSAWLSDLHLMNSSLDLFLFLKLITAFKKSKVEKNCIMNPGVLSSSLKDCQHFLSSLICSPLPHPPS